MPTYERVLSAIQFLQLNGLSQQQLNRLHPSSHTGREVSFNAVKEYFSTPHTMRVEEQAFANRLCYIAEAFRRNSSCLAILVERSLDIWPHTYPDMAACNAHMRRASGQEASVFAYV